MTRISRSRRYLGLFFLCVFMNAVWAPVVIAGVENEGNAAEVDLLAVENEDPLQLKNHFFSGTKFSLEGSEEKSVFGLFGGIKSEYKEVVSSNEEALNLANSAGTLRTVGSIGGFGLILYGAVQQGLNDGAAMNNLQSNSDDNTALTYMLLGLGVSTIFGIISLNKINQSAAVYNEGVKSEEAAGSTVSLNPPMPVVSPQLSIEGATLAQVQVFSW